MNVRSIQFRIGAWYAGLLAVLLAVLGGFIYFTLHRYLENNLQETLTKEAQTISDALLSKVSETGDDYVVQEIEEHFAPRTNNHFVRVTRGNGSVLYQSGEPENRRFDPSRIREARLDGPPSWTVDTMPTGRRVYVYSTTYANSHGTRYSVQAGASDCQINLALTNLLASLAIVLPLIVGVSVVGGYLLMRRPLRPLHEIAAIAEQITSRNLNERLSESQTGDEIEQLTKALNRMMSRLEESFHHVHRFSADVSHEIRTPLAVLRAELEDLIQSADLTSESRNSVASALEEAERLSRVAEQLLEMTRLEAGEMLAASSRVNFSDLTQNAVDQMRLLTEEKQIQLRFESSEPVHVIADPVRLRQVVVNLVDNAIKYTPAGGTISVSNLRLDGKAVLDVSDTGIGIPHESLPYLFERFYRVDGARSRHLGGTGLGLAIVKSICTAFGGSVTVHSTGRTGTTFRVELPLEPNSSSNLQ
jgi:heavy metal sensor kinase